MLTVARLEDAVPLARALVAGGLPVLEVTLRTPVALDVIRAMAHVEGAIVGAGTVLNGRDVDAAFAAGARFLVSPGFSDEVVAQSRLVGAPLLPGVATASEVMRGLEAGFNHFKFFPAAPAGGVAMLKAFAGPFAGCRFCPTGGITPDSAPTFVSLSNVPCVGGTWVAPADLVAARAGMKSSRLRRVLPHCADRPPPRHLTAIPAGSSSRAKNIPALMLGSNVDISEPARGA